ncbi:MAG: crotonase/enoyl-CoA hydratase family protein [Rhodobacteraceae bacterium]|nr:crotonase/enoyl-CoA hydratase family protein [Paracoccaceae bacterium]MCP5341693.1 crotonase/enoyl-CoA hydratase family protein [Paracoccaceae bacterium]
MYETIRVDRDARGVATIWLNRPDRHNVMSGQMMTELHDAALTLGADADIRVVVMGGLGPSFCAGGDLGWMRAQMAADAATRAKEAAKIAHALQALNTLPKPLIGRIHGNVMGGGVGIASVCDVAVAAAGSRFGLTETKLGLIPATISPYVIARMGEARARRVMMSSRLFDAEEARDLGVVARVVAEDTLDAAVEAEVTPYLSCAPGAVAAAKALTRRMGPQIGEPLIAETIQALVERWESPECAEGIAAFFDKRPPMWTV